MVKTLAPKIWLPGSVRSSVPSAPPLLVHWAAYRLCGRVLGIAANLSDKGENAFIHLSKDRLALSTTGRMGPWDLSTQVQRRLVHAPVAWIQRWQPLPRNPSPRLVGRIWR